MTWLKLSLDNVAVGHLGPLETPKGPIGLKETLDLFTFTKQLSLQYGLCGAE